MRHLVRGSTFSFVPSFRQATGAVKPAHQTSLNRAARWASGSIEEPLTMDEDTVNLHRWYHDRTVDFTVQNYEWVNSKSFETDAALSEAQQEQVFQTSKARLQRWPHIDSKDMHDVPLGPRPQRFCKAPDAEALGDPMDNVFIISLPRRPAKLRHALAELHEAGVSATIVDAIYCDAFTSQEEVAKLGAQTLPGYCGHKNTLPHLTSGQLGCFMSHFAVWQHMVDNNIPAALILEDDFDLQDNFVERLGEMLEEARGEDWNLMYLGRSPTQADVRRATEHLAQPGYTLWTVAYIFKLDAARALVEAQVQKRLAPLDHYFSIAMRQGMGGHWNENAVEWSKHIPNVLRGLAITPPLVMPYVGSMFLSDTAMMRKGTKFIVDLPEKEGDPRGEPVHEAAWRARSGVPKD